ncbi:MAG TPA: hypothetical protein VKX46_04620 [Ktedonobacteraceae bacterium]|nr:hypothetical protein [Ktedonobacteraceae bacterium]
MSITPFGQSSEQFFEQGTFEIDVKGGSIMPDKKPLKGVSNKEERQYEHIKESAEKSGRYGDRAKEVAARTVMKHHKEEQHKKGQ